MTALKKMKDAFDGLKYWSTEATYQITHGLKERELPVDLGLGLHDAAIHGEKYMLRKILKKGHISSIHCDKTTVKIEIDVDYPNSSGQTALFCACFENQENVIGTLLKSGADPNKRCDLGSTPMHAAGYSCNIKIMARMIEAGGDLRLHDSKGRTIRYWAICNPEHLKRHNMVQFMEKTRSFAMSYTGKDILRSDSAERLYELNAMSNTSLSKSFFNFGNFFQMDKKIHGSKSNSSFGYGKVYVENGELVGGISIIPIIAEGALRHDKDSPSYFNGSMVIMEGMFWNKSMVTVKRLHRDQTSYDKMEMLIRENEYIIKLRHPHILLLMGTSQTNNLDGIVLIFERVDSGSLHYVIHQQKEKLTVIELCSVMFQISDALLYIHNQNLLHCNISSHAVQLINNSTAKLCNFEYMCEIETDLMKDDTPHPLQQALLNMDNGEVVEEQSVHGPFNWLAPELLNGDVPTLKSDVYSLCAVLWEILHGQIPWSGVNTKEIIHTMVVLQERLLIDEKIQRPFDSVLHYGLKHEPTQRDVTVEQFRDLMLQMNIKHTAEMKELSSKDLTLVKLGLKSPYNEKNSLF